MTNGAAPATAARVKRVQRHWHGKQPLYEVDFDEKTIMFGSGYIVTVKDQAVFARLEEAGHFKKADPVPFVKAAEVAALLQADLAMKPTPPPEPIRGPERAPDFIQKNINQLLEIEDGYIVKRGPKLLRWLWPYVIVKE